MSTTTHQDPRRISEDADGFLARLQHMAEERGLDLRTAASLDTSRTETRAEREARAAARTARYQRRWEERVPVMYADATLEDLRATTTDDARRITTWLAHDVSPTLIVAGSVGTGKTHAAYAIGHLAARRGRWVEAWTTTDLLEELRPSGHPAVADAVRRCDLLILDDFGASKPTDWAVETLTSLVDHRLRDQRRQIITTNHPEPALAEAWGQRLMDRLMFRATIGKMTGNSRRREAW